MIVQSSSIRTVAMMLDVKERDVSESNATKIVLPTEDVSQRSRDVLDDYHVDILKRYVKHGKNFDYRETNYYRKFSERKSPWKHVDIVNRIHAFFKLFDKIGEEGLKPDIDPLLVIDLRPFQPLVPCKDSLKKKDGSCVDFFRCNGSHRCAIALMKDIPEMPVVMVELKVSKAT